MKCYNYPDFAKNFVIYVCTAKGGAIMNILEELYYGNIVPNEKYAKLNSEVKELLKLLNRNEEKLTVTFPKNRKSILKNTRIAIVKFLKSVKEKHSSTAFG